MKTGSNLNEGTPKADKVVVESSTKEKVTKSSSSEKQLNQQAKLKVLHLHHQVVARHQVLQQHHLHSKMLR